jgi:hypothetical protein|tara:strand:- start:1675 stop:2067 length:393 start_codon:yes stop_codon:yes gene_type:complete
MAATPEDALKDAVEAIGDSKIRKYRDTIHPPVHQIVVSDLSDRRFDESNIPEYMSDVWEQYLPDWVGSTCTLNSSEIVIQDSLKIAYLIKASRLFADGSLMQTFDAIFTVGNKDGDWRLISRNPFNITKA